MCQCDTDATAQNQIYTRRDVCAYRMILWYIAESGLGAVIGFHNTESKFSSTLTAKFISTFKTYIW